jgi:hypothetical protein
MLRRNGNANELDMVAPLTAYPVCPRCGCADLRQYKTILMATRIVRYRICRHCSHRVLTRQPLETIIRDVSGNGKST